MRKLLKLKEWLTISDTAKYLSVIFGEEVKEADVLRLALDGHLRLSVNFVNNARAKHGQIVNWEETEWFRGSPINLSTARKRVSDSNKFSTFLSELQKLLEEMPINEQEVILKKIEIVPNIKELFSEIPLLETLLNEIPANEKEEIIREIEEGKPIRLFSKIPFGLKELFDGMSEEERENEKVVETCNMTSLNIDGKRFINLSDRITTIRGVWDLSMIGNERHDIEHTYQSLTGGPAITLHCLEGCFVEKYNNQIYQLVESDSYYQNDYRIDQPGSKGHLAWLKTLGEEELGKAETEKLLSQHEEARKQFIKDNRLHPKKISYYPADGLPDDCALVVRTAALKEFEQKFITDSDDKSDATVNRKTIRPESTRKTENLLKALASIAIDAYGYDPDSAKSNVPQDIVDAMSTCGVIFDPRTVRSWLKDGASLIEVNREKQ